MITRQKVSGALRKAGIRAAKYERSGMVRGWGDWSSGVRVVQYDPGEIRVFMQRNRWAKETDASRAADFAMLSAALDAAGLPWSFDKGRDTFTVKEPS